MKTIFISVALLFLGGGLARAQGTVVYDQQSATDDSPIHSLNIISSNPTFGQSFVPDLSAIDFVRLSILASSGSLFTTVTGAVSINLWSGGISNGILLASTAPVALSLTYPRTVAFTNFFFPMSVPLTPGTTYFFEALIQPADGSLSPALFGLPFYSGVYPRGTAFLNGVALTNDDLWFREGIVVAPEPTIGGLFFVSIVFGVSLAVRQKWLSQTNALAGTNAPAPPF